MTEDSRRQRLISLGPEALADALLELSQHHEAAENVVARLLATPDENVSRFRARLVALKSPGDYRDWRGSLVLAQELSDVLKDLCAGVTDSKVGVQLMAEFFECDSALFECCDDSDGHLGDIFRFDAKDMFVRFAAACQDKSWLSTVLTDLYSRDDYGVRAELLDSASAFLPDSAMRALAAVFLENFSSADRDSYKSRRWIFGVESLSKQLHDPLLYQQARLAYRPEPLPTDCLDIARVYLDSGNAQEAFCWLQRVPEDNILGERDILFFSVCQALGRREDMEKTSWRLFRGHRDQENFHRLLSVIGEGQRENVIDNEVRSILLEPRLSYTDAIFLLQSGRTDDAERYVLEHAKDLNGELYPTLLALAEGFEKQRRRLPAYVLYKALLESILSRAVSKYYHHGVKYLGYLDTLARNITDWKAIQPHAEYFKALCDKHGKKRSFWSKVESGR